MTHTARDGFLAKVGRGEISLEGWLYIQKAVRREQGAPVTRKSSMGLRCPRMGLDSGRVLCSSWLIPSGVGLQWGSKGSLTDARSQHHCL